MFDLGGCCVICRDTTAGSVVDGLLFCGEPHVSIAVVMVMVTGQTTTRYRDREGRELGYCDAFSNCALLYDATAVQEFFRGPLVS